MPPASLSTLAVMNPGPTTAKNSASAALPALEQDHRTARQLRCRSIVITSSAVMMPASRPCSSTTASVIRLYLSNSAATSSSGVSGAQAMYGSLSSRQLRRPATRWRSSRAAPRRRACGRRRSGRSSPAPRGCLRTPSAPRSHRRRPPFPATAMNSVVMRPAAVCSPNSRSCVTSRRSSGSISLRISPDCVLRQIAEQVGGRVRIHLLDDVGGAVAVERLDDRDLDVGVDLLERLGGDFLVDRLEHRFALGRRQVLDDVGDVGRVQLRRGLRRRSSA